MNPAKLLALLLLLLTLPITTHAASPSYVPEMEYLRLSPDTQLTPQQALSSNQWQLLPETTPNFGYIRDHIWLRFPVSHPELITLLEISYPQLDQIDFYLMQNNDVIRHESTGDKKVFSERPVKHPHFLFPFQLQPEQDYQILLRVETEGAMQVPLRLWNNRSYFEKASIESQLHAGYYGILITVICFNLFVFLALREPVYLLYVLSTFGYLILVGSLNGITYQLLWPDLPAFQTRAMLLTVPFAMVFTLMFSRSFLRLNRSSPMVDRLVLVTIALNLLVAAITFVVDYSTGSRLTVALAIPSCLLLTVIGPLQWAKGNPQAVYYTLAWGALTLGSAITGANKYGLIPNNFITAYGMQIGSALEAILLSLALAVRIYRERQDKVLAREAELRALEARRSAELRLMDQALHNPLTGLPNRSSYEMRLSELVQANACKRFGIVVIHLNNLNSVTKTLGHRNSDRILELASKHFNAVIRDVPGAIAIEQSEIRNFYLASLEPQTFAFLVNASQAEAAHRAVLRSIEEVRYPMDFLGMQVPLAPQLGVAFYPDHGADASTLIRRAVIAEGSERARDRGIAYYKPARDSYSADRLTMVSELRHAIDNNGLALYLQPKLSLKSGTIDGFEALMRWPGREQPVRADELIALAEQSGLIKPLTRWVLQEALEMRGRLRDLGFETGIAVNISPNNLREPDFAVFVQRLMQSYHSHTGGITFEVTETSMMQDPLNSLKALNSLHAAGIPISIDDFGSGYSSLSYIKQLPASEIKIDRSLISDLSDREQDRVIVRTTIDMCHSLGYTVVAEGVEDEATLKLLEEMGCDLIQGYLLTRPLPFDEMINWLSDQPSRSRISAS
ncbi:EAL domain-containing protein [Marinobacter halophilus]|uniref:Diguanylate cyclase n=1 Tax=Marinobacter halophilus TaxID=1323740 RepID=A0A2T1KFJ8_9GAMM|nr:EAL domain-containing protein [Marinobacter halophilus]PSF08808.1 diguanylate cyclase [Marinobacter halophilus]